MKSVVIGKQSLSSPVMLAAGICGYGEFIVKNKHADYTKLGALVCKTTTRHPRKGNPQPWMHELPFGMLNSVGLANVGVDALITEKLPLFRHYPCAVIISIAGESAEECAHVLQKIEMLNSNAVWGWEINVSCPNIRGGTAIGYDAKRIEKLLSAIRPRTEKPLLVKLPPCTDRICELGRAAEQAGADAITASNTVPGMWIDTSTGSPVFARGTAGLSGEAIFPIALALVHTLCSAVSIPVIAVGGITSPDYALQFLLAGARAVQIGSAHFKNPLLFEKCYNAIEKKEKETSV